MLIRPDKSETQNVTTWKHGSLKTEALNLAVLLGRRIDDL